MVASISCCELYDKNVSTTLQPHIIIISTGTYYRSRGKFGSLNFGKSNAICQIHKVFLTMYDSKQMVVNKDNFTVS